MNHFDFVVDQSTQDLIELLKKEFNVAGDADVLQRVLGLAKLVAETADVDGIVHIRGYGQENGIDLALRA